MSLSLCTVQGQRGSIVPTAERLLPRGEEAAVRFSTVSWNHRCFQIRSPLI